MKSDDEKWYEEFTRKNQKRFDDCKADVLQKIGNKFKDENADANDVVFGAIHGLDTAGPVEIEGAAAAIVEAILETEIEYQSTFADALGALAWKAAMDSHDAAVQWVKERYGKSVAHELEMTLESDERQQFLERREEESKKEAEEESKKHS